MSYQPYLSETMRVRKLSPTLALLSGVVPVGSAARPRCFPLSRMRASRPASDQPKNTLRCIAGPGSPWSAVDEAQIRPARPENIRLLTPAGTWSRPETASRLSACCFGGSSTSVDKTPRGIICRRHAGLRELPNLLPGPVRGGSARRLHAFAVVSRGPGGVEPWWPLFS
jgi:hypothetical protein